jgi:hypothetical protein
VTPDMHVIDRIAQVRCQSHDLAELCERYPSESVLLKGSADNDKGR